MVNAFPKPNPAKPEQHPYDSSSPHAAATCCSATRINQHLPHHNFQDSRGNHCCAINWEGNDNTSAASATRILFPASLGHCTTAAYHRGAGFHLSSNKELELLTRSAKRSNAGFCWNIYNSQTVFRLLRIIQKS